MFYYNHQNGHLDNWGEDVLALQFDGGLFYWDTSAGLSSNLASTTEVSGAPTKSRFMLVSGDDRHVICFGTETTIGTTSTQDNMFIRWSSQESTSDGHQQQLIQQAHID